MNVLSNIWKKIKQCQHLPETFVSCSYWKISFISQQLSVTKAERENFKQTEYSFRLSANWWVKKERKKEKLTHENKICIFECFEIWRNKTKQKRLKWKKYSLNSCCDCKIHRTDGKCVKITHEHKNTQRDRGRARARTHTHTQIPLDGTQMLDKSKWYRTESVGNWKFPSPFKCLYKKVIWQR